MNDTDIHDRNMPRFNSLQSNRKTCHFTVISTVVIAIYLVAKIFLVFHAAKKTNRVIDADNNNGGVIVDETLKQQSAPHDSSNQHKKLIPVYDFNCSSSLLGLPPGVAARCRTNKSLSSQSSEFDCSLLTCSNLIHGHPFRTRDTQLYQAAVDFFPDQSEMQDIMREHDNQTVMLKHADLDVIRQLQSTTSTSCKSFLISQGFVNRVDTEAEDFPIAYSLLLHADARQVVRLLRAIYRPNNVYCLHIDRKSTYQFWSSIQALAMCFDNVQVVSNPVKIVYEGFSRLLADINCMKDLVQSKVQWKYLINTAGKKNHLFEEIFRRSRLEIKIFEKLFEYSKSIKFCV